MSDSQYNHSEKRSGNYILQHKCIDYLILSTCDNTTHNVYVAGLLPGLRSQWTLTNARANALTPLKLVMSARQEHPFLFPVLQSRLIHPSDSSSLLNSNQCLLGWLRFYIVQSPLPFRAVCYWSQAGEHVTDLLSAYTAENCRAASCTGAVSTARRAPDGPECHFCHQTFYEN